MADRSSTSQPAERYRRYVADTMAKRIPLIIRNAGEGADTETVGRLEAIGRAVAAGASIVIDLSNWPFQGWEEMPARVNGRRISDAPFFDFEYWLYFRILEAVRFGETRIDPFRATKHRDFDKQLKWADEALERTTTLSAGLKLSLDANAHDLSQIGAPTANHDVGRALLDVERRTPERLNIIADNFGAEFVADVVLAIVAAEMGIEVVVHVKQLPMFVSDATADDVTILFDRVGKDSSFGRRLLAAVQRGSIRFSAHAFWSAPKFLDRLPVEELGRGEGILTVLKGDLNFRRAIGDASVAVETPFQSLAVLPASPMLSLRSIKSYCVAGMTEWPKGLSRIDFPMDGSIVVAQEIPVKAIASAESSSDGVGLLQRARRWFRSAG
ncbi:MAG: ARMT1-like domain-containing protein [Devosia sp.]